MIDIAISRLDRCKNVAHLNVRVWHKADMLIPLTNVCC